MEMTKNYEDKIIPYILVFFGTLNVFQNGAVIWLIYTVLSIIDYGILKKGSYRFYGNILISFCVSVCAIVTAIFNFGVSGVVKAGIIFLSCLAGYGNYNMAKEKAKYIFRLSAVIFTSYLTQVVLIYFKNIGNSSISNRTLYSLWTNEEFSVTLAAVLCTFIIGYAFYMIFLHKSIIAKIISVIALVFVVLLNFETSTRTPFFLMIALSVITLFYIPANDTKTKFRIVVVALLVAFVIGLIWYYDILELKTTILKSALFDRMQDASLESARWEISKKHFSLMFDNLFGGNKISESYSIMAHNLPQETHDMYGIFAFVAILFYIVDFFSKYINLIMYNNKDSVMRLLFFIYSAVLMQMFTEPILEGYPILLWNFILIHSIATAYLYDKIMFDKEKRNIAQYC